MSIKGINVSQILCQEVGEIKDYEYIALLRRRSGLSQNELYALTGIHPQHLSECETGKRELPSYQVAKIIQALKRAKESPLHREGVL